MTDEEIMEKIDQYWEGPDELPPDDKVYICEIVKQQIKDGDPDPVYTAVNAWTNEVYRGPVADPGMVR